MEPIIPISGSAPEKSPRQGTAADLVAAYISGAAALAAFGGSVYAFWRFLENDTQIWGTLSAFILCFGIGALAYIPAAIIGRIAVRAHRSGTSRRRLIGVLALLFPWLVLSLLCLILSPLPKIYSAASLIITALLGFWASYSLYKHN